MRYPKGSIRLGHRDADLLRFVADGRYITNSQLSELARLKLVEFGRPVFNWRIRRLMNAGLLRKQVVPFLGADVLYSITAAGIRALETREILYLGDSVRTGKDFAGSQIPHVLELNRIRLALERSHVLMNWTSEVMVRMLNLSPTLSYAKAYDAIATVRTPGGNVEFAIEYERTLKSARRYEKIVAAIQDERRVHTILYLAPSFQILSAIRCFFERCRGNVVFSLVSRFERDVLGAEVSVAGTHRSMTLEEVLRVDRCH